MSGAGLLAHIARAEGYVAEASRAWDPASVSCCTACAAALERAVAEVQAAGAAAARGAAAPGARTRLERLRSEVERLARLVDAALAFCRGFALRAGDEPLAPSGMEA